MVSIGNDTTVAEVTVVAEMTLLKKSFKIPNGNQKP